MCSLLIATSRSAFYSRLSRQSLTLAVVVKPFTTSAVKQFPKRTSFVLGTILMTTAASNCSSIPTSCQRYPFPDEAVELDTYSGVELKVSKLNGIVDPTKFAQDLKSSLDLWMEEGKRGIWIYIPTHMAHLVPVRSIR
jgi:Nudix hydrolase domain